MRIGLDFDNTIVGYDALFYRVALEQGAIPAELPASKLAVRDYLRCRGEEDVWTRLQGYVYGARMNEALAYPGVIEFLRWARDRGVAVSIISHKTRYPYAGARYDLHRAAREWVSSHLNDGGRPLVEPGQVFFELTKNEKIARIRAAGCDYYVDDLPEILLAREFPAATLGILFDPEGHHREAGALLRMGSWGEIQAYLSQACRTAR
jgi:hypothetical protein